MAAVWPTGHTILAHRPAVVLREILSYSGQRTRSARERFCLEKEVVSKYYLEVGLVCGHQF